MWILSNEGACRTCPKHERSVSAHLPDMVRSSGGDAHLQLCRSSRRKLAGRKGGHRYAADHRIFELSLLLLIGCTPRGNGLFGAAPLNSEARQFIIAFMPGMLLPEELRKTVPRKMS